MGTKLLTTGFLFLFGVGFYFLSSQTTETYVYGGEKLKGVSFVAPSKPIADSCFKAVTNINAGWVSLMPYGFVRENTSTLIFSLENDSTQRNHQWWGETPNGVRQCIRLAKGQGLKVMMKPHIWLRWGEFTGHMTFKSEKEWEEFEKTFSAYILGFAKLSEEEGVELFCIATEMEKHVEARPEFWHKLITDVKKVYSGKLTYAENWDSFEEVPFWNELDYIGVDGYFPLSDHKNPDAKELKKGWEKHLKGLKKQASKYQKPILFTEFGYRSCDFSTQKPWDTDFSLPDNHRLQDRAYEVLFTSVWNEPWMAGGFLWKWFPVMSKNPRHKDMFSPQGKPAEQTIKKHFAI